MAKWAAAICVAVALSIMPTTAQSASSQMDRGATTQQKAVKGCVVRDAANGGRATVASGGISYLLAGSRDMNVDQYLGKRVEVTGTVDPRSSDVRATSGSATPLLTDKGTTNDRTRRLEIKTIRIVSPTCLQ